MGVQMGAPKIKEVTTLQAQRLVSATAEKMRDLILERPPDALIGSLPELAKLLDVGINTVQQAARVLEHEGILAVRRGPGGGYFGRRPDALALERSLATYLRVRRADDYEALRMMTLLDCELMPAAAHCTEVRLLGELRSLKVRVDQCHSGEERIALEDDLHAILFRMVDQPLVELLAQVSIRFYRSRPIPQIFEGEEGLRAWRQWRHHIIDAILSQDPERARFEAERHRRKLLQRLERERGLGEHWRG
jgi:GntR family transcriptional repressor for pyruvate dehydrogenase complex